MARRMFASVGYDFWNGKHTGLAVYHGYLVWAPGKGQQWPWRWIPERAMRVTVSMWNRAVCAFSGHEWCEADCCPLTQCCTHCPSWRQRIEE